MHALNVNCLLNHSTTLVWHHLWCAATDHSEAHILGRVLICQKLQWRPCCWLLRFVEQMKSILTADIIHGQLLVASTEALWAVSQFHFIQGPCCLSSTCCLALILVPCCLITEWVLYLLLHAIQIWYLSWACDVCTGWRLLVVDQAHRVLHYLVHGQLDWHCLHRSLGLMSLTCLLS
jgi:hypothetical protein